MTELVTMTCPNCATQTTALIPCVTEPVGTVTALPTEFPPDVDTAVRTDCPNDHGFVVYLEDR